MSLMGEMRSAYKIVVGKSEGKRILGKCRHRWKYNVKVDFEEIGCEGVDWIHLAQDMDQ
jgi:hypothetical protein